MLVATPGQTASYSTLHNSSSNGGGNNNATSATSTTKKSSTNATNSGTSKPLNNNNNHATSTITTKSSTLNSNSNSTIHNNYHPNTKNDNIVLNKLNNQIKTTGLTSREINSSSKKSATTHSLKTENSTTNNSTSTTNTKQQSFIQTLKDSVQKALISTTGSNNKANSIAAKHSTDNKLQNNCNNTKTSVNNVTSSSSTSTNHNPNKVSTTTSLNISNNATAATQSSSAASGVRGKYFSCSLSKLHTVAPTIIHRYPEERQNTSSTDSLHKEMCHFKPIRIVPKTPFKSGSKSRGNSLRFPKANLATKKNEFVLKSNCDVNNRKRKQQQNKTKNNKIILTADEDDDENEQENKEFHRIYKPKPSLTCLSTSFNTPNHTSAFVCLIADMQNFVNMQAKNQLAAAFMDEPDDSITELFSRKKQKPIKKQLQEETVKETPKTRRYRQSTAKSMTKDASKRNAKTNNISKASKMAITKAKSLRNVGRAKSKTNNNNNMIDLAALNAKNQLQNSLSMPTFVTNKTKTVAPTLSVRKRKAAQQANDHDLVEEFMIPTISISPLPIKSTSNRSILVTARKSTRLSAKTLSIPANANTRARYSTNQISSQTSTKYSPKKHKKPETVVSFSPPMTRSRLKHLTEQGKLVETVVAVTKKRKI